MDDAFFKIANIGLTVAIEALMANDSARAVIAQMLADGRRTLTPDEIAAMAAESEAAHADLGAAIEQAKAEGR